ncbi:hypothetical protein DdX_02243 [Ditylenchus destructor]|uniref:Uncharacterized protein n=1 Tax=Ditylenchus destructor TaxID=166010 RepID=A0AAD4R5V3_9BILA|nr:hypothetical protein DdX_02243 [Ditylenchus destructor]
MKKNQYIAATDFLEKLTQQCEELERGENSFSEKFANQMERLKQAARDNISSRSSEEKKRAHLDDLRQRTQTAIQETESMKSIMAKLRNAIHVMEGDEKKENEIIELVNALSNGVN